jgi:hypothetical protein
MQSKLTPHTNKALHQQKPVAESVQGATQNMRLEWMSKGKLLRFRGVTVMETIWLT